MLLVTVATGGDAESAESGATAVIRRSEVRRGGGWFVENREGQIVLVLIRPEGTMGASLELTEQEAHALASVLQRKG